MAALTIKPYEGKDPYIFVSYSHRDTDRVMPMLEKLTADGYRIWYDEGIDPGTEWPESIAEHLMGSTVCLAFISENSLKSHNCRREINFALSRSNIGFLSVLLEEVKMSPGVELQLSSYQSLLMYKYGSRKEFLEKLSALELLAPCKEEEGDTLPVSEPEQIPNRKVDPVPATPSNGKNKKPLIFGAAAVALVAIVAAVILMLSGGKDEEPKEAASVTTKAASGTTEAAPLTTEQAQTQKETESAAAETASGEQTTEAAETAGTETEAVETEPADTALSDDLADYTFRLDETVYQLPFAFAQLAADGWTISENNVTDAVKLGGYKDTLFEMSKNGGKIQVYAVNNGGHAREIKDCVIGTIIVNQGTLGDPERFGLGKGIGTQSTLEEVQTAFGTNAEISARSSSTVLNYKEQDRRYAQFEIYEETTKYNRIRLTNYPAEQEPTDTVEEAPEYLNDYVAPEYLGDEPNSGQIRVLDEVYVLPAPLRIFVGNGWTISRKPASVAAFGRDSVTLEREGKKLSVFVENRSEFQTLPENCVVTRIDVNINLEIEVELAGGIRFGTEKDELDAMGFEFKVFEQGTYKLYTLADKETGVEINLRVGKESSSVENIHLEQTKWDH